MIDATRLTALELVRLHDVVGRELTTRREARGRQRHERKRAERMEAVSIGAVERVRRHASRARKPGDGGRIIGVDRERGVRFVECSTCPDVFDAPLQRGRAPRSCPSCVLER